MRLRKFSYEEERIRQDDQFSADFFLKFLFVARPEAKGAVGGSLNLPSPPGLPKSAKGKYSKFTIEEM